MTDNCAICPDCGENVSDTLLGCPVCELELFPHFPVDDFVAGPVDPDACELCGEAAPTGAELCPACLADEQRDPEEEERVERLLRVLPDGDYTASEMAEYLEGY